MSSRVSALAVILFVAATSAPLLGSGLGCGGGTPKPKDEDDTASSAKPKGDDSSPSSSATADSPAPAPAADSSPPATPAPASSAAAASGDIPVGGSDDPWMAGHQMTPKDVFKTMRPAQGKVQACFKAGLKRDGSTSGEVKVRFVITNDGVVRVWRDDGSSMTDGDVTQCVGDVVHKLKFPKQKSPGDAWGVYSINFTP
jgi:hypothetical protein